MRGRQRIIALLLRKLSDFFLNDVGAKIDTFITDKNRRASNQLLYFMLALATKRAMQNFIS
jgi:hypothetical protein